MTQVNRLAKGGLIQRDHLLNFQFDGKDYQGYQGDTLASALLANNVQLMARSFKYHRPRGVMTAGSHEPNALVQLRSGARHEPNTRATMVELYSDLVASSQNAWPNLRYDVLAINNRFSKLLGAGFYYKTFMWPSHFWETFYEPAIRRAAGLGTASLAPDPDDYERITQFCDVLVVGAGAAGLVAAKTAALAGARVVIVDEQARFGGSLLIETLLLAEQKAGAWAEEIITQLTAMDRVICLSRTTAFAYYDQNVMACVERVSDHLSEPLASMPRQRLWRIRARQIILACGAIERPLVFNANDRPAIMQASATRAYTNQYGVNLGRNICLFTNNDSAYQTLFDLLAVGIQPKAVIETREQVDMHRVRAIRDAGVEFYSSAAVIHTKGRLRIREIEVKTSVGNTIRLPCDHLAMSGGWNPNGQLHSQTTAKLRFDEQLLCFVPSEPIRAAVSVGAAAGEFDLGRSLVGAYQTTLSVLVQCGFSTAAVDKLAWPTVNRQTDFSIEAFWCSDEKVSKAFVDFQHDVTAQDIHLAAREGFVSVEHLKRYTTLGMATDQGKGANVNGLAILAQTLGKPIAEVGTTSYRPPVTPVSLGVFAGQHRGKHMMPMRKTTTYEWAQRHHAVFTEMGLWLRPYYYPLQDEGLPEAAYREVRATRQSVGLCDISTLGKIEIQGKDAIVLLERVYCNHFASLRVGKARYGLMLREDGMVMDDGTTSRLGERQFFMTTTPANAAKVMAKLSFHLQVTWPDLDARIASVTEQWAGFAIAGPNACTVLQRLLADDMTISPEAFPFLSATEFQLSAIGTLARLLRISFSGELAYELYVPSGFGEAVWEALMLLGAPENITPYGTEALTIMRIEKGHIAEAELSGNTTATDLGLGKMLSQKKDYIGRYLSQRPALQASDRETLVGLEPMGDSPLWEGAHIVALQDEAILANDLGYISSATWSPSLDKWIALALIKNGQQYLGKQLRAVNPLIDKETIVRVVSPHFFDPDNKRSRQ